MFLFFWLVNRDRALMKKTLKILYFLKFQIPCPFFQDIFQTKTEHEISEYKSNTG